MYLDVPFKKSGLFKKASNCILDKGRKATQPTFNIINKMHSVNLDTCKKLLRALVSSVVLYAALIWSLNYMDELENS